MQLPLPLPELMLPVDGAFPPPPSRRVFCNRNLRLDSVQTLGFDMDYTLAVYDQEQMDRLSIEATARKLVDRGHPERLLSMDYRTDYPIRGLLIDRKLGNVLKMDRYKYVKRAYHGLHEISRDERRHLYHSRRLRPASARYHWVDTLYALSEVSMYAAAVEALERDGRSLDYDRLFADVRECIDLSHQDGSILDHILGDLPRFVQRDVALGRTLHKLRSAGKKLFLLTNSRYEYTDRMMRYLFDGALPEYPSWRNFFDLVICAAKKPKFFTEQRPFEELLPNGERRSVERPTWGRIYEGGNLRALQQLFDAPGDTVLYVGDHIYGDVLRAKKETAWRTMMIIQEMDAELAALEDSAYELDRSDQLEAQRARLHDELREHQVRLKVVLKKIDGGDGHPPPELEASRVRHRRAIDRLRARLRAIDTEYEDLEHRVSHRFHPFWGSLMKAGPEVSSFGNQVETYACLYTTRVSNLYLYSPMHYFQSPRDRMPHELERPAFP